ncbi:zf-TFIIB domain-containing protein [Candidatus Riflebacteria bacterium]
MEEERLCPQCVDITPLEKKIQSDKNVLIDSCPRCHGTWFDKGEFFQLLELNEPATDKNSLTNARPTQLSCPVCMDRKLLDLRNFDSDLEALFFCPYCKGTWLEKGKFEEYKGKKAKVVKDREVEQKSAEIQQAAIIPGAEERVAAEIVDTGKVKVEKASLLSIEELQVPVLFRPLHNFFIKCSDLFLLLLGINFLCIFMMAFGEDSLEGEGAREFKILGLLLSTLVISGIAVIVPVISFFESQKKRSKSSQDIMGFIVASGIAILLFGYLGFSQGRQLFYFVKFQESWTNFFGFIFLNFSYVFLTFAGIYAKDGNFYLSYFGKIHYDKNSTHLVPYISFLSFTIGLLIFVPILLLIPDFRWGILYQIFAILMVGLGNKLQDYKLTYYPGLILFAIGLIGTFVLTLLGFSSSQR